MELARRQNGSSSHLRGQTSQLDSSELNDDAVLEAINTAANEYGFCPNRIWVTTWSLPGGIWDLPKLLRSSGELRDTFSHTRKQRNHQIENNLHKQCTLDFCEQSQINFTSISQRHESPSCKQGPPCEPLEGLFPRRVLDDAVEKTPDGPTAWQLNGAAIIEDGRKYMALSHVWSDGTGSGAWDGLRVNKCLYHFFRKLARDEFGCEGIWWDTICVPGKKVLREKALANMHVNYEKAEITFVHDCFLRNLPWINAETACIAIIMSPWFSRGWTALELAKSKKGRVKVAFKGTGRPLIKDLDNDILAKKGSSNSHKLASSVIEKLRKGYIRGINDLQLILGSRHTSWTRDMAVISALLVGADITGKELQQDLYQKVLTRVGGLYHAHLFHNLPTINKGLSWSPVSLHNMPRFSIQPKDMIQISKHGEAVGQWKVVPLDSVQKTEYVWKDTHPLIAAKLRSCLKLKGDHVLLVEPGEMKVERALLVKMLNTGPEPIQCQFVGSVYFYQPQQLKFGPNKQISIANLDGTEAAARDYHGEKSQGRKGTIEDEHSHSITIDQEGTSKVQRGSQLQQTDMQIKMQAPENDKTSEVASTIQGTSHHSLQETVWLSTKRNEDALAASWSSARREEELLEAAKKGNAEKVQQLINEGADIGFQDEYHRTPTSWAAKYGHHGIVELLLKQYDVDYDCMDNASQISSLSARTNLDKNPKAAVERNVETFTSLYNLKDAKGRTPLLLALKGGHRDMALLLLRWYETQYKPEPRDDHGRTPLWWAAKGGHEAVVKLLLATGKTDVDLKDNDSRTPLSRAAEDGYEAVVKLLLATGKTNINSKDSDWRTPLSWAAEGGDKTVVKLLLATGKADIDSKSYAGQTPLWWAAFSGHEAVVKLLLATGKADIDSKSYFSRTPLSWAARGGHETVVKLLLATGKVDVNWKDSDRRTPLLWAVEGGHEAVVKLLLMTNKVDVNLKDYSGRTALSLAARRGHEAVVKLLLATSKTDINSKDDEGRTPLSWAVGGEYEAVVKLLLATGKADVNSKESVGGVIFTLGS